MKPGARIVSHNVDIKGIKPEKVTQVISKEDGVAHDIYLWTIPLKKDR
jgi:hypothetical protein